MNSSGILLSLNQDKSAAIGFEDYNVETFGGSDYEAIYYLDVDNFTKLLNSLGISSNSDIKKKLIDAFGENFNSSKFEDQCADLGIKFKRNVWISGF